MALYLVRHEGPIILPQIMLTTILILFALAAAAPVCVRVLGPKAGIGIAGVSLAIAGWYGTKAAGVISGDTLAETTRWVPSLGVDLVFTLDGLSLLFALLICGIGGLVLLYTSSYMAESPGLGRFYATLLSFMAAMLGLVLADNLIIMFVFWELTSITSFMLIGFDFHRESARRCAWQALVVTGLGGLSLLAGVILLAIAGGGPGGPEFSIAALDAAALGESSLLTPTIVLILLGCFSKSAMVPFHFWLPNAMEAPSPVSALLHSSTMVKAGVYLIARLHPDFAEHRLWSDSLVWFGAATMLTGAVLATRHVAFKKILAYSTVSSLGIMVMLIGLGAYTAAGTYLLAHALFKACLFLVAGSAIHAAGTKDTEAISQLGRVMPISRVSAVLGGLSLAGVVPLLGFAGKELAIKATMQSEGVAIVLTTATGIAALLTVFAGVQVVFKPFFLRGEHEPAHDHECAWPEWTGPLLLGVLGLVCGLLPGLGVVGLVDSFARSLSPSPDIAGVKLNLGYLLWPISGALLISVGAVVFGVSLFLARKRYRELIGLSSRLDPFGPERTYDRIVSLVLQGAGILTMALQNGSLRIYIRVVVAATVLLLGAALLRIEGLAGYMPDFETITAFDLMLALTIVFCAVASTIIKSRLGAIAALSGIGFAIAVYFIMHGAPDLAGTQFAVETLVVVIFVLVIHRLPRFSRYTKNLSRAIDIGFASAMGIAVTVLTLIAIGLPVADPVSEFQAAKSVPSAYGRNVINVILVDYRAMDTLGEIFVLAVAAIGVFTLLTIRPSREPEVAG